MPDASWSSIAKSAAFVGVAIVCKRLVDILYHTKKKLLVGDIAVHWSDRSITASDIEQYGPLTTWTQQVDKKIVRSVDILSAFKPGKRIVFLHAHVDARMTVNGECIQLPGIVTFRGPSVAVLLWCFTDEGIHILMVEQMRVAVGRLTWEPPAGMLENKTCRGAMFDEIREEVGLTVHEDLLVDLGTVMASPGLLDETFHLYAAHCPTIINASARGLLDEGEIISNVAVFHIDKVPIEDAKIRLLLHAAGQKGIFESKEVD